MNKKIKEGGKLGETRKKECKWRKREKGGKNIYFPLCTEKGGDMENIYTPVLTFLRED